MRAVVERGRTALAIALLAAYTTGCASTILLQPQFTRRAQGTPADADRVALENTRGAELSAFLSAADGDYGTVMVSGGNAMGKGQTYRYTSFLRGQGFRVMTFSFEGYDSNTGEADLGSMAGDARAIYDELNTRFPGEPVAYLASSISTAAALCLPARTPELSGVILEGAINLQTLPFQKMVQWWPLLPLFPLTLPYAGLVSATVPSELAAGRCARDAGHTPALFVHHPRDIMTSYASARRLYDKYAGPKEFVVLRSRNRQYHLLLARDRAAQSAVLTNLRNWLQRPD